MEILQLAGRDETPEEARWALYSIIIYANEYGQPKSQDLADGDPAPGTSGTSGSGTSNEENRKRKR